MPTITRCLKKTKNFQILSICEVIIEGKSYSMNAIWDTGSAQSHISTHVINQLNLEAIGSKKVGGIDSIIDTKIYNLNIRLERGNDFIFNNIEVVSSDIQSEYLDFLIGMDIISQGDFYITHSKDEIRFDFVYPPETK